MIKKNEYWSSYNVHVFLIRFKWNLNILGNSSKNSQILNFIEIRPVWAELFHSDGPTDMTKLTVSFRNFANAPKMTYTEQ